MLFLLQQGYDFALLLTVLNDPLAAPGPVMQYYFGGSIFIFWLPVVAICAALSMRLVAEDLALEGDPARNLATFVTTWMEPEAQRIIAENLHRNFIDHAEYPRTAEIEQRCIRMLADLFHGLWGVLTAE